MTTPLALAVSGIVLAIAGVHAYWGCGGNWPAPSQRAPGKSGSRNPGHTGDAERTRLFLCCHAPGRCRLRRADKG
jgi:hypothetical protein